MTDLYLVINPWIVSGTWAAALGCFLWGMVSALLSPCHLASIPLIVGYVGGQNRLVSGKQAAFYAMIFSMGLFITIAAIGFICAMMGRMLGDIGPYWTVGVGVILFIVAANMMGISSCSLPGGMFSKIRIQGYLGAFVLGLAYGVSSGSCTFGFIAPILAIITVQEKIATGMMLIVLFGVFKKASGLVIFLLGLYFVVIPFV